MHACILHVLSVCLTRVITPEWGNLEVLVTMVDSHCFSVTTRRVQFYDTGVGSTIPPTKKTTFPTDHSKLRLFIFFKLCKVGSFEQYRLHGFDFETKIKNLFL